MGTTSIFLVKNRTAFQSDKVILVDEQRNYRDCIQDGGSCDCILSYTTI